MLFAGAPYPIILEYFSFKVFRFSITFFFDFSIFLPNSIYVLILFKPNSRVLKSSFRCKKSMPTDSCQVNWLTLEQERRNVEQLEISSAGRRQSGPCTLRQSSLWSTGSGRDLAGGSQKSRCSRLTLNGTMTVWNTARRSTVAERLL